MIVNTTNTNKANTYSHLKSMITKKTKKCADRNPGLGDNLQNIAGAIMIKPVNEIPIFPLLIIGPPTAKQI